MRDYPLTKLQNDLIKFFISFMEENFYQPTLYDMAANWSVTPATIHQRLKSMQKKGYLTMTGRRGIALSGCKIKITEEKDGR